MELYVSKSAAYTYYNDDLDRAEEALVNTDLDRSLYDTIE